MGYDKSVCFGYGVRVENTPDPEVMQEALPPSQPVRYIPAGPYDANWDWLYVNGSVDGDPELHLGRYRTVPPYSATDEKYLSWDWQLVETAQKLGVTIVDGPAWFFVPDET